MHPTCSLVSPCQEKDRLCALGTLFGEKMPILSASNDLLAYTEELVHVAGGMLTSRNVRHVLGFMSWLVMMAHIIWRKEYRTQSFDIFSHPFFDVLTG